MVKMTKQKWEQIKLQNENKLNEECYKILDQEIKKEHTYGMEEEYGKRVKHFRAGWIFLGNGNWKKRKIPTVE